MKCSSCHCSIPKGKSACPACARLSATHRADDALREALGTRYDITAHLGKGAFGEVYKATDTLLNRTIAIKRIRLDGIADPTRAREIRDRFLREAQVAAQLHHPNIVTVFDIIKGEDTNYIVMEYVDGVTLGQRLRSKKPLPIAESVYILSRVADALHHAHEHKVIHRDVKPGNILLSRAGEIKVTDFGVAKVESSQELTTAGVILGTPDYMSPEQARGGTVDARSDLFSLGCIFYECLTGQAPFRAKNLTGVLIRIVNDDPGPIDFERLGLPAKAREVFDRSLAKNAADRFENGATFARALRTILGEHGRGVAPRFDNTEQASSASETPDSVADSLMKEARRTTHIEPHLSAFKKDKRKLRLSGSPLLKFRNVSLTPEEAFILSRIHDEAVPSDILSVSPLGEEETARALLGFLRAGLVSFEEPPEADEVAQKASEGSSGTERVGAVDENTKREIERLYEAFHDGDDWKVLGLEPGSYAQVTKAFQAQAFRFHPERYRAGEEPDFRNKVTWLFQRVSTAFANLSAESVHAAGSPT